MCSVEQALPYVALAVLCPAAYEGMARAKLGQLLGATDAVALPHVASGDRDDQDEQGSAE